MKKVHDFYFKKAKKEKYLARSIYKLEEMDKSYNLFKNKKYVIDLGSAPGSWIEYAVKRVGQKGQIFGIDLKPVQKTFPPNVHTVKGDLYKLDEVEATIKSIPELPQKFDIVMSDMAPNTTGQKDVDAYKSFELCVQALRIADKFLKQNGTFITKIFMGEDFKTFLDIIKASFKKHKVYKPKSSRSESKEIFIIGWEIKNKIDFSILYQ